MPAAGALPETVAINLWGLDAIKTKVRKVGVRVAVVLAFLHVVLSQGGAC